MVSHKLNCLLTLLLRLTVGDVVSAVVSTMGPFSISIGANVGLVWKSSSSGSVKSNPLFLFGLGFSSNMVLVFWFGYVDCAVW